MHRAAASTLREETVLEPWGIIMYDSACSPVQLTGWRWLILTCSCKHSWVSGALQTFPRAATPSCPVSEELWAKVRVWHYPLDSSFVVDYAMWAERVKAMKTFPSQTSDSGWLLDLREVVTQCDVSWRSYSRFVLLVRLMGDILVVFTSKICSFYTPWYEKCKGEIKSTNNKNDGHWSGRGGAYLPRGRSLSSLRINIVWLTGATVNQTLKHV